MFKVSFPAKVLYYYLKRQIFDCELEYKIFNRYRADIYIPFYQIIIEYYGWYFHDKKEREEKDKDREECLKEKGFKLIKIKEVREETKEILVEEDEIKYHLNERYTNLNDVLKKVIELIEAKIKIVIIRDINWERDYQKIEDMYFHLKKMRTLSATYPRLIKEYSKKNTLSPDSITYSYKEKVYWICPICSKEYMARVSNRTIHNSACPRCSKIKK